MAGWGRGGVEGIEFEFSWEFSSFFNFLKKRSPAKRFNVSTFAEF